MHAVQPSGPSSQPQLDVTGDEKDGLSLAQHRSATAIESWFRLTIKLGNHTAMQAANRKETLENRACAQ